MIGGANHLSIVVFADDEAHLLHGTILSVERAMDRVAAIGIASEVLVIHYSDDASTAAWLRERCRHRVVRTEPGSLGRARNRALAETSGRRVAFIDGTDLWSANFLSEAIKRDRLAVDRVVWRPAISIGFPDEYAKTALYSARFVPAPPSFDPLSLLEGNPFTTTFLARRSTLERVPFPIEDAQRGWNDADGWWCANLAGEGVENRPIPYAIHYFRAERAQARALAMGPRRLGPTTLEGARKAPSPEAAAP